MDTKLKSQQKQIATEFVVGRLLASQFRGFLERCRFLGLNISWHESSAGLVEKSFVVKGPVADMVKARKMYAKIDWG